MTTAVLNAAESAKFEAPVSRSVRLVRVAVLLVAGMAIAFSAVVHEDLGFDLAVTAASLGAIGVSHLIEWVARRRVSPSALPLLLAIAGIAAAVVVVFTGSAIGFAVTVAGWALISALLEFIGAAVRPGSRSDATLLGSLGVLLAILTLLVREDPIAVLGFFGAYAVMSGVFLGIAAFDSRGANRAAGTDEPAVASGQHTAADAN